MIDVKQRPKPPPTYGYQVLVWFRRAPNGKWHRGPRLVRSPYGDTCRCAGCGWQDTAWRGYLDVSETLPAGLSSPDMPSHQEPMCRRAEAVTAFEQTVAEADA